MFSCFKPRTKPFETFKEHMARMNNQFATLTIEEEETISDVLCSVLGHQLPKGWKLHKSTGLYSGPGKKGKLNLNPWFETAKNFLKVCIVAKRLRNVHLLSNYVADELSRASRGTDPIRRKLIKILWMEQKFELRRIHAGRLIVKFLQSVKNKRKLDKECTCSSSSETNQLFRIIEEVDSPTESKESGKPIEDFIKKLKKEAETIPVKPFEAYRNGRRIIHPVRANNRGKSNTTRLFSKGHPGHMDPTRGAKFTLPEPDVGEWAPLELVDQEGEKELLFFSPRSSPRPLPFLKPALTVA
jgi:hypothetical protein